MFCKESYSKKFWKIYRKTSLPDLLFNKLYWKRDPGTSVFLWILQTPFLHNTSGRLLLDVKLQNLRYTIFQMTTNTSKYFHICISIPLRKRLWSRCLFVNFTKLFKSTFFTEHIRATASEKHRETLKQEERFRDFYFHC